MLTYLQDNCCDIAFLSETWLFDTECYLTSLLKSEGNFTLFNAIRKTKTCGGGVSIFINNNFKCSKLPSLGSYTSFEHIITKLSSVGVAGNTRLVSFYRRGEVPFTTFITEFTDLITHLYTSEDSFIICGDFNIHMNRCRESNTVNFLDLVDELNLSCHFPSEKTHEDGNTIDFVITDMLLGKRVGPFFVDYTETMSDHFPVLFDFQVVDISPSTQPPTITKRDFRNIDIDKFRADTASILDYQFKSLVNPDFPTLCQTFNESVTSVLDHHAPLKSKKLRYSKRPNSGWFDHEYRLARAKRRRLHSNFKRTALHSDKLAYVQQRTLCSNMAREKRIAFYTNQISSKEGDQKALFKFSKTLLDKTQTTPQLPDHVDALTCANESNHFFTNKIKNIRDNIPSKNNSVIRSRPRTDDTHTENRDYQYNCFLNSTNDGIRLAFRPCSDDEPTNGKILSAFRPTTDEEVLKVLKKSGIKVSPADPVPAHLLVDCMDEILPFFTVIINASLSSGCVDGVKEALVLPLLKSANLDYNIWNSYRPISNLPFISKLTERIVASRLNEHMDLNNLHCNTQYGYKQYHSTETLLLKFMNDILVAIDNNSGVVVLLIDLSAAFDTVDHQILLKILHDEIGICGTALKWFHSFLTNRTQRVGIGTSISDPLPLLFGVPQGSVLGPVLFNIYSRSLSAVFSDSGFSSSGYADDNSGLRVFTSGFQTEALITSIADCLHNVKAWMDSYFLKLNENKSEIIVFGSEGFQRSIHIKGAFTKSGECIRFSNCIKYLGVHFDKCVYLDTHVNKVVSSCYHHLRGISSIRRFLSQAQAEQLIHAFISSKLDMCNALFFGLSKWHLSKLQRVQNAALRIVLQKRKRDSVSDSLRALHWLTIEQRVVFKILTLVFKCLNDMGPIPLTNLLVPDYSGDYSPAIRLHEGTFRANTVHGKRAFAFYAPRVWNCLPGDLRSCCKTDTFKKLLKTYIFTHFDVFKSAHQ